MVLVLVVALFSTTPLFTQTAPQQKVTAGQAEPAEWVILKVTGITCAGCAGNNQKALTEKEGVLDHEIKFPGDQVKEKFDSKRIKGEDVWKAIIALGYKAEPVETRQ